MQHSIPRLSAIKRIEIEAYSIPGAISLAQGVPSLPSDERIRNFVIDAIRTGEVDRYSLPAGVPELRRAIADSLASEGFSYDPETEIVATAGAMEAISATIHSLVAPGDEVMLLTPTYYANYRGAIEIAKAVPVDVPLDPARSWRIDFDTLVSRLSPRTRAIIVCNPNNPTGTVHPKEDLVRLGALAVERDFVLIVDDVYPHMYFGEGDIFNLLAIAELRDRIIRIVSFSKDFSLSGWRIGFLHGDARRIVPIVAVHDRLINCAPVVSQYAAIAALRYRSDIIADNVARYRENRRLMCDELAAMGEFLTSIPPEGTYYCFPKIREVADSETFAFDLLHTQKLAVVPGSDFGPGGEGHIRLCFGREREVVAEGMRRLRRYFESRR